MPDRRAYRIVEFNEDGEGFLVSWAELVKPGEPHRMGSAYFSTFEEVREAVDAVEFADWEIVEVIKRGSDKDDEDEKETA